MRPTTEEVEAEVSSFWVIRLMYFMANASMIAVVASPFVYIWCTALFAAQIFFTGLLAFVIIMPTVKKLKAYLIEHAEKEVDRMEWEENKEILYSGMNKNRFMQRPEEAMKEQENKKKQK